MTENQEWLSGLFSINPLQNVNSQGSLFKGNVPAAVFSQGNSAPIYLPGPRLVPQLSDQLMGHAETGSAYRMAA